MESTKKQEENNEPMDKKITLMWPTTLETSRFAFLEEGGELIAEVGPFVCLKKPSLD